MPFNVNEFSSSLNKAGGPALTSNFMVEIHPPKYLTKNIFYQKQLRDLQFRIETIDFPQRSATAITNIYHGPAYKFAGASNYVDITLTAILSSDFRERDFFLTWQDLALGKVRTGVDISNLDNSSIENNFDTGYYNDYIGGISIKQYQGVDKSKQSSPGFGLKDIAAAFIPALVSSKAGEADKEIYTIKLIDAFPTAVQGIAASWAQPEVARMQVTMTYRYFTEEFTPKDDIGSRPDSLFDRLNKSGLGGAIGTVGGVVAGKIGSKATTAIFTGATIFGKFL